MLKELEVAFGLKGESVPGTTLQPTKYHIYMATLGSPSISL